jgi:hypothetical protein
MKYFLGLWQDESGAPPFGTPEFDAMLAAYGAYHDDVTARGLFLGGDPLARAGEAVTIRVRDGVVSRQKSPFHRGAEQLIGFYLLDCHDQAEVLEAAAKIPAAQTGAIEVRAIHVM